MDSTATWITLLPVFVSFVARPVGSGSRNDWLSFLISILPIPSLFDALRSIFIVAAWFIAHRYRDGMIMAHLFRHGSIQHQQKWRRQAWTTLRWAFFSFVTLAKLAKFAMQRNADWVVTPLVFSMFFSTVVCEATYAFQWIKLPSPQADNESKGSGSVASHQSTSEQASRPTRNVGDSSRRKTFYDTVRPTCVDTKTHQSPHSRCYYFFLLNRLAYHSWWPAATAQLLHIFYLTILVARPYFDVLASYACHFQLVVQAVPPFQLWVHVVIVVLSGVIPLHVLGKTFVAHSGMRWPRELKAAWANWVWEWVTPGIAPMIVASAYYFKWIPGVNSPRLQSCPVAFANTIECIFWILVFGVEALGVTAYYVAVSSQDGEEDTAEGKVAERKAAEGKVAEGKDAEEKDAERKDAERKDTEHKQKDETCVRSLGRPLKEEA